MRDYAPLSLRQRIRRWLRQPAAVRKPTGWNAPAAYADGDSFDRLHQQHVHRCNVMTLRVGPGWQSKKPVVTA